MDSGQAADVALAVVALFIFVTYHIWLFCIPALHPRGQFKLGSKRFFNAQDLSRLAMSLWLRNNVWICSLFGTATAYIGARGLPEAFLSSMELSHLFHLNVLNTLTPHSVVPTAVKAGIATCIIIIAFLAFALATRNYVWVGFNVTVITGRFTVPGWQIEGEVMSMLKFAEIYFSIGTRAIVAFGCTLSWFLGSLALVIVTIVFVAALAISDHQCVKTVDDMDSQLDQAVAFQMEENRKQSPEKHHLQVYGFAMPPARER